MAYLTEDRQVLVNLEINKDCELTKICGDSCFLNLVEQSLPGIRNLSSADVLTAAREVIDNGRYVRHLALVGKEPLDTPELLFEILRYYHESPIDTRPGTIGINTSGLQLRKLSSQFVHLPIDWCAVSVDTSASGLHVERLNRQLVEDLLQFCESGATEMALVNTVFTEDNHEVIIDLGKWICASGIDQWALSTMMKPSNGRMTLGVSQATASKLLDRVISELADVDCQILFEVELDELRRRSDEELPDRWRIEHNIEGTNVWLVSPNFGKGYFVRMRWDGQLLTKQDFLQLGLTQSTFGQYSPGRFAEVLSQFARIEPAVV